MLCNREVYALSTFVMISVVDVGSIGISLWLASKSKEQIRRGLLDLDDGNDDDLVCLLTSLLFLLLSLISLFLLLVAALLLSLPLLLLLLLVVDVMVLELSIAFVILRKLPSVLCNDSLLLLSWVFYVCVILLSYLLLLTSASLLVMVLVLLWSVFFLSYKVSSVNYYVSSDDLGGVML